MFYNHFGFRLEAEFLNSYKKQIKKIETMIQLIK